MTSLTFDAHNEDGSPRVFAGMHRPPLEEIVAPLRASRATMLIDHAGRYLYPEQVDRAWREGGFDSPLYYTEPPLSAVTPPESKDR